MRSPLLTAALCAVALVSFGASADGGRPLRLFGSSDLVSTTGSPATGKLELLSTIDRRGREATRLWLFASDLDVTRDARRRLPRFDAFLTPTGGGPDVLLGRVRVNCRGRARLGVRRLDRVLTGLGIDARAEAGATLEVRGAGGAVLTGTVPQFAVVRAGLSSSMERVYGHFIALQEPRNAPGSFIFRTDEYETGEVRNRLTVRAPGVTTGPNPSTYAVRVMNAARNRFVELGAMTPEPQAGASLMLDSRRKTIPGGIVRWSEFSGGRIEVRIGGSVRLRGDISPLRGVGEDVTPVGLAHAAASVELRPTAGLGVGLLEAAVEVLPNKRRQRVSVRVAGLFASNGPYTVVATANTGTRTTLGTFETRGLASGGVLVRDTRRGHRIGGGGVVRLGGQAVEIVDAGGTTVLTATFPVLAND